MPQPIHHTASSLSAQLHHLMNEGWKQEILPLLPEGYQRQAHDTGAFTRQRKLKRVEDLLRGLLAYVLCRFSLRDLGAWSILTDLADISHVAWQKRLRNARAWFLWLLTEQLAVPAATCQVKQKRVLLIDATRLKRPGGCGDDWRVHLGYDLRAGRLVDLHVSDRHTAEGFSLFEVQAGDLFVGDRAYCRRTQAAFVLHQQGEVILRFSVHHFPLQDQQGRPLDVLAWLNTCGEGQHSRLVRFTSEGHTFSGRLLARSLPQEAAQRARERQRRKASKQQWQLREETLALCGWFLVFTSLPREDWSDEQVLGVYRARWQIELFIKRLKQLLKLAQLRGQTALTNEATILALLVAWSLIQTEVAEARQMLNQAVQHWQSGYDDWEILDKDVHPSRVRPSTTVSSWTITALGIHTLRQLVQGVWTFDRLHACWPRVLRMISHHRRRVHQETAIRRLLSTHQERAGTPSSFLFFCTST